MNKFINHTCDAIDYAVEWSDWFNPFVWQALWMAGVANVLEY